MSTARFLAVALVAISVPRLLEGAPDARALIAGLAREAPARIAFAEARFSSLLRKPIVTSGELGYLGQHSLDRRVTTPYRETTTIRGGSVRIERDGEESRTFALKRAPELEGFLDAFTALLGGDVAALERHFSIAASGEDGAWKLELTPRDARPRRRLRALVISGGYTEPLCFAMLDVEGGGSVMLVGSAAAASIEADASLEGLLARCAE